MPALARRYLPGSGGTAIIDAVHYKVQGWNGKDSVDDADASATEDAGWSCTEAGLRTSEISFTMGALVALPLPAFNPGDIMACVFTLNGTIAFAGDYTILTRDPKVNLKGIVTFDVTCRNHGAITVGAVTPP